MKPINSVTTTLLEAQLSKTGMPDGERGLVTQSNSEIAARLAQHLPTEMDKKAEWLAQSCGVKLRVNIKTMFPSDDKGNRLPCYNLATGCDVNGTDEQRQAAIAKLEVFQTAPPKETVEEWLAELSVLTAGRGADGLAADLMLSVYSSRLAVFPADVVRYALLVKTWKWFPTWDELEKICTAKAGPRQHMIAALSKPAPEPVAEYVPPTQEERDSIDALVAEQFPLASKARRDATVREILKPDYLKR